MHSNRSIRNLPDIARDSTDTRSTTELGETPAAAHETRPTVPPDIHSTTDAASDRSFFMLLFVLLIAPLFHFFVLLPREQGMQSASLAFSLAYSFGATTIGCLAITILTLPFFYLARLIARVRPVIAGTSTYVLRVCSAILILTIAARTYWSFHGSSPVTSANTAPFVDKTNFLLEDNLYRNYTYKFRIKFPASYRILKGDGPNVLVKATDEKGATINIIVQIAASPSERNTITASSIDGLISEMNSFYKDGFRLLDSGLTKVSNEDAIFLKYDAVYSHVSGSVDQTILQFMVVDGDFTYIITCNADRQTYAEYDDVFMETVNTFILESRLY